MAKVDVDKHVNDSNDTSSIDQTDDDESTTSPVSKASKDSTNGKVKANHNSNGHKKTPDKKTPTKKTTPSKSAASPKISYIQLVLDAIVALKGRNGSSQVAIQNYILSNHPEVPEDKLKQRLLMTLKAGVANQRLVKVKASFKIHPNNAKKQNKKKKSGSASPKKKPTEKPLSKEELAAKREKERQEAKEKERQERIRKRKFPMDDLELIAQDKELKVSVDLPARPSLPLVLPDFPSSCKTSNMGGPCLLDDAFHVYHFFRGDVGWGLFPRNKNIVAPFTLQQWLECIQLVLRGTSKKARMLPPLMIHLFVVALQHLIPADLQVALTPVSWSEILVLYMDAMERYYTTEASLESSALPGVGIDTEYLLGVTDEPKDESLVTPPTTRESNFYLHGSIQKAVNKLMSMDPWMLSADDLVCLLRVLVDDLLAAQTECAEVLDYRLVESYDLLRRKKDAEAHYRKIQALGKKEQNEEKERLERGDKATRSNSKLPTVSEAQLESARRAQQKAADAYDRACRSQRIRTEPVGEDRNFNAVYHFWNDPERVYVAMRGKQLAMPTSFKVPAGVETYRTTWHSIDKRSTLKDYVASLDIRGKREYGLQIGLQAATKMMEDDAKLKNDMKSLMKDRRELQRRLENAKLKCEVGRKSGRLAGQSEQEFAALQEEIDGLDKILSGGDAPEHQQVHLELSTGLAMLRNFENKDAQNKQRRTNRREVQKKNGVVTTEEEEKLTQLQCSKVWATGNIDGTGVVGSIIWDLLELEERVDKLASLEEATRKTWITTLENAAHSWHASTPPELTFETSPSSSVQSPDSSSESKKSRRLSEEPSAGPTAAQTVQMIKQPLLQLEQRIFEMSGLAMAAQDADLADDNMSASPEEYAEEQLQLAWKKLVYRLNRLPAKAPSKIRHTVVEAIAAARKAQQPEVVAQLREALLQFHPEAAGACKAAALEILEKHGGHEEDDDEEDESDDADDEAKEETKEESQASSEVGLSSVLSFEAVILNSSLDGHEDASRADWISAVKKTRTVSKLGALVAAFCTKSGEKLSKLETEQNRLHDAIASWEKSSSLRKKSNSQNPAEPSEVWTNVTYTDEFCLAKVEEYPWWPAKRCVIKDEGIRVSLERAGHVIVSLVGESGGLRVVGNDCLLPFSLTLPEDKTGTNHPKEIRVQLDECMAMARRVIRGKEKKVRKGKRSSAGETEEFKEEKKLST